VTPSWRNAVAGNCACRQCLAPLNEAQCGGRAGWDKFPNAGHEADVRGGRLALHRRPRESGKMLRKVPEGRKEADVRGTLALHSAVPGKGGTILSRPLLDFRRIGRLCVDGGKPPLDADHRPTGKQCQGRHFELARRSRSAPGARCAGGTGREVHRHAASERVGDDRRPLQAEGREQVVGARRAGADRVVAVPGQVGG
jgi:hypothetical protein